MRKLSLLLPLFLFVTACSDKGAGAKPAPNTYNDPVECDSQKYPVGIPGNKDCPYKGDYDPNLGYQGYAIYYETSASIGVGFYIDFGWTYNDLCPKVGDLPIFQNGSFSHCESVNPTYAQTDYQGYTQPNTGECLGDQYMSGLTGCEPTFQPSHNTFYPTTTTHGGSSKPLGL